MPDVTLSRYECTRDLLPPVCTVCGEPATEKIERKFSWHPQWSDFLIVGALVFTKRMSVRLPHCARHAVFWRRRNQVILITMLVVLGLILAAIAYAHLDGDKGHPGLQGWFCGGAVLLVFVWSFGTAIVQCRDARATRITDRSIRLTNVHARFVTALLRERKKYANEDPDARWRYGDVRDDYDDEPDRL